MTARLSQQKPKVFRAPTLLFYFWRKLTIKNFQPFLNFLNRRIILQGFEFSIKLELQLSARPLNSRVFSILDYDLSKVLAFKLLLFQAPALCEIASALYEIVSNALPPRDCFLKHSALTGPSSPLSTNSCQTAAFLELSFLGLRLVEFLFRPPPCWDCFLERFACLSGSSGGSMRGAISTFTKESHWWNHREWWESILRASI